MQAITNFCFCNMNGSVAFFGDEIENLAGKLTKVFDEYFNALR